MVVIVDENVPPRNATIASSPNKFAIENAPTPNKTVLSSPGKTLVVDENTAPPSASNKLSQVAIDVEKAPPISTTVTSSPVKVAIVEETCASPCPGKVEMSPLCERGQKRTALSAYLPEIGGVEKARPIIDVAAASPHTESLFSDADSVSATSDPDNTQAPHGHSPVSLELYKTIIDATTELQEDGTSHVSTEDNGTHIPAIQRGVEWQDPAPGAMMGYAVADDCNDDEAATLEMSTEHPDRSTVDIVQHDLSNKASEEVTPPLQITVAWQDPAMGTMLGYAFCDDNDEDVQAMQCLFHDQEDQDESDSAETSTASSCEDSNITASHGFGYGEEVESISESEAIDANEAESMASQMVTEWKDPISGIVMGYACDEESEFVDCEEGESVSQSEAINGNEAEEVASQMVTEWKDPSSGIVMGYACDEESEFGDHLDEPDSAETSTASSCSNITASHHENGEEDKSASESQAIDGNEAEVTASQMVTEWKDPSSGIVMGYACDEESEFGDHLDEPDMKLPEWEDPETGALMGYGVCDEASDEDHSSDERGMGDNNEEQAVAPQIGAEWKDPATGIVMSYEYDEDSDFGDHLEENQEDYEEVKADTPEPARKQKKSCGGRFKRKSRLLVLRLRRQHLKRVIKGKLFRKNR